MCSVMATASYLSELIDAAIHHAVREAGLEKLKTEQVELSANLSVARTYSCRFQPGMASLSVLCIVAFSVRLSAGS